MQRSNKMGSIRNISASTAVPPDLAKKVGVKGVDKIIKIMWEGYRDVKKDTKIKIDILTEEDDITQKWAEKVQKIWFSKNRALTLKIKKVSPIHQYHDNTMKKRKGVQSPTIDFCFKDWSTDNSYFGVEAKNLYSKRPEKISRYVSTGIDNYTNGRYGGQSSESSIIGYVLSGTIDEVVESIKSEVLGRSPIANLTRTVKTSNPQYYSKHIRSSDSREITLHHLFFDFSA